MRPCVAPEHDESIGKAGTGLSLPGSPPPDRCCPAVSGWAASERTPTAGNEPFGTPNGSRYRQNFIEILP